MKKLVISGLDKARLLKVKLKYGSRISFEKMVYIANDVSLNNVKFGKNCNVAHHAEINNAVINNSTSIGRYTKLESVDIGKFCSISWNTTIGASKHPINHLSSHAFPSRKKFGIVDNDKLLKRERVVIGNDVWIGCHTVVMPGISIGDGAVVGAGSVVTKNVKPYEIVAGNPAKHLRFRFPEHTIDKLLKYKWWDLHDTEIKSKIEWFKTENFEELLNDELKTTLI